MPRSHVFLSENQLNEFVYMLRRCGIFFLPANEIRGGAVKRNNNRKTLQNEGTHTLEKGP